MRDTTTYSSLVRLAAMCLVSWISLVGRTSAQERITVDLLSGRRFEGFVDVRTDELRLWLRQESGHGWWLRPIDWRRVVQVTRGAEVSTGTEFQVMANQLATVARPIPGSTINLPRPDDSLGPRTEPAIKLAGGPSAQRPSRPRLTNLQIEGAPANWDADVETDGLAVRLMPLDEFGQLLPVDGNVQFEFIGEAPGTTMTMRTLPTLGRWTRALTSAECGPSGYVVRLPYQATHPEFDLRVGVYGLVRARLVVAGEMVCEASADLSGLRPYSPLRDRLQQLDQQRFFPQEPTGRGRVYRGLSNGL